MNRTVIGISAGHGGPDHSKGCYDGDPCAACGTKAGREHGIIEAEYVSRLGSTLRQAMSALTWPMMHPARIIALNEPDESVSPSDRGERARWYGCNMVLALHVNASRLAASGAHMLHRPADAMAIKVATEIAKTWPDELKRDLHGRRRQGTYVAGMVEPAIKAWWPRAYALLESYAPIPTVLVECFYASRKSDCLAALDYQNKLQMVAALMTGIAEACRLVDRQ